MSLLTVGALSMRLSAANWVKGALMSSVRGTFSTAFAVQVGIVPPGGSSVGGLAFDCLLGAIGSVPVPAHGFQDAWHRDGVGMDHSMKSSVTGAGRAPQSPGCSCRAPVALRGSDDAVLRQAGIVVAETSERLG